MSNNINPFQAKIETKNVKWETYTCDKCNQVTTGFVDQDNPERLCIKHTIEKLNGPKNE